MKKVLILSGILGFITLQGCDNSTKNNSEAVESTVEQPVISSSDPMVDSGQQLIIPEGDQVITDQSAPVQDAPGQASPGQPASMVAKPATGMNPAHGEPGHRCDIDVGAPLSSPPGNNTPSAPTIINSEPSAPAPSNPIQVQPQITTTPAVPSGPTAPGMNPPHGEPGHDCAIPVGSPLKK